MVSSTVISWLLTSLLIQGCSSAAISPCSARDRPYSAWMADSVIARGQAIAPPGETESSIFLQIGFFQTAILRLLDHPGTAAPSCQIDRWEQYLTNSTASIASRLGNATQDTHFPLDRLSTFRGLLHSYEKTNNTVDKKALDALRRSIDLQPTNKFGGLWYFTYPNWSYLDGMYSLIPFSWLYATRFNPTSTSAVIDESIHQLDLLWQHCHQNSTGLLVHGYDGSQTAVWASSFTGASPIAWDRSLAWYFMTLVDMLELLSLQSPGAAEERYAGYLQGRFAALAKAVLAVADADSGCWWQVMTAPREEGNYIESSGSAMFTYALLKGARLGFLDLEDPAASEIVESASKCYRHLVTEFVAEEGDGTLGYNGTVSVCSLNSSATYEYYVNQPLLYNSVHGSAAFVLASLEHEMLANPGE
ncbi:cell wall glycosyl hydrolase YteR [Aspergillus steynii IBT 23096]|uniref:Cell wall glycosyl hydrolase YteR n=1 Tax=Aspergillus steynii IBT 23096 TaxID=1392250 RepID=A0A2I2G6L6_9EURO|nr:cell wall glycosyl hydrolase YteR [Aspergillus steynii IBT 23096]PLB48517.1 cell wall glycosyl hydrolase YteR [Aspergillus steynii IBT 23096]